MQAATQPKLYNPRHPERTLLYQTVAEHYETWLDLASAGQFDGQGDHRTPKPYVRKAFAKYLECGVFAHVMNEVRASKQGAPDDQEINATADSLTQCKTKLAAATPPK